MKIALVYDRVNKWGGAERVLLALHEMWPEAPLFTAVYDKKSAGWADVFEVHPSFLHHIPFAKTHHEWYPWLTPMAFESFNFDEYDVVLSVTSAEAKAVITKPGTVHICYCLTPTRYLWSGKEEYENSGIMGNVLRILGKTLRRWDLVAASRPDRYIAISEHVAKRIRKYYHREVEKVIYPPVDTDKFKRQETGDKGDYFLCVTRLVPYKRVDLLIDSFNTLGWPLKIIGSGSEEQQLKKRAKNNIEFISGDLTDQKLVSYYQKSRAFVFAGQEDFGIAAAEAQACGKPVICPRDSGMAEIIIEGVTGELFESDMIKTLHIFAKKRYDSVLCRKRAEFFSKKRFKEEMTHAVQKLTI